MESTGTQTTRAEGTYSLVAELPLRVESYSLEPLSRPMSTERVRRTSVIHLAGGGEEGIGEDATPIEAEQLAFQRAEPMLERCARPDVRWPTS